MTEEHYRTAAGIWLSVDTRAGGRHTRRPVVLLAGTGATSADWHTIARDLSRDRVVHAIDLRGHGRSSWPGSYSIDALAADLVEVLPQIAASIDVVGHSLGGLVACKAALAPGTPIDRLVLEDVGVLHPRPAVTLSRPDGDLDFDWAVVEQVRPEIDDPDPTWPQILQGISLPTLAISGGPQSFVPPDHVRELAELVPHGTYAAIDAGHLIHETEPARFLEVVRSYLDAVPGQRPDHSLFEVPSKP